MSKIYNQYLELKETDDSLIYLFKIGIFYIFLDEDAKKINGLLSLKLTHFNESIMKCGFPIDSLEKYLTIFEKEKLKFKIIDKEPILNISEYNKDKKIKKLLDKIKKEDINKMNGIKALNLISELKEIL